MIGLFIQSTYNLLWLQRSHCFFRGFFFAFLQISFNVEVEEKPKKQCTMEYYYYITVIFGKFTLNNERKCGMEEIGRKLCKLKAGQISEENYYWKIRLQLTTFMFLIWLTLKSLSYFTTVWSWHVAHCHFF